MLWVFKAAVLSSKEGGEKSMLHRMLAVLVVTALMVAVLAFPALATHGQTTAGCAQAQAGPGAAGCRAVLGVPPGPPVGVVPPGPP